MPAQFRLDGLSFRETGKPFPVLSAAKSWIMSAAARRSVAFTGRVDNFELQFENKQSGCFMYVCVWFTCLSGRECSGARVAWPQEINNLGEQGDLSVHLRSRITKTQTDRLRNIGLSYVYVSFDALRKNMFELLQRFAVNNGRPTSGWRKVSGGKAV